VLGLGPKPGPGEEDENLIDAGKNLTTLATGGCYVHHADAFLMIRGGHLDISLLGAFEVSETGDLANWTTEDPAFPPGVGGAMDLAVGAGEIRVLMAHTHKSGSPRILHRCTLPLTAPGVVKRIYTDLAVIDVTPKGLVVLEMIPGMTLEHLQTLTEPTLQLAGSWQALEPPQARAA
jgi:3-oxoadipate CoA-transferase beta subunit